MDLSELLSAPEEIEVEDYRLRMDAHPWRNFEPGLPPQERTLSVMVTVIEMNEQSINALEVLYVWVVQGEEIWSSLFSIEERPPTPDYEIEKVARDGPKWDCDSMVDVIVGIRVPEGDLNLIRSPDCQIECPE
jgi:hypothetical protein